jgi:hypothetical protein
MHINKQVLGKKNKIRNGIVCPSSAPVFERQIREKETECGGGGGVRAPLV